MSSKKLPICSGACPDRRQPPRRAPLLRTVFAAALSGLLMAGCSVDDRQLSSVAEDLEPADTLGADASVPANGMPPGAPDSPPAEGTPEPGGGEGELDTVLVPDGGLLGNPGTGSVGESCTEGVTACDGVARLLACEAGAFVERELCEFVCQPLAEGAQCAGECEPEARSCLPDGTPSICNASGQFQADTPCPTDAPRCVGGECRVCVAGERRCNADGVPEACAEDGSGFSAEAPCAGEAPLCVPETGSCGQCSVGSTRSCVDQLGSCADGTQECGADNLWGPCSIQPAPADSCVPGDDADCDGQPNEGCACTVPVACGPAQAVGICRPGVSECVGGVPGVCEGAVGPRARDCRSQLDNDCDGAPDDALDATCQCAPGTSRGCDQHPGLDGIGICRAGSQTCVASAGGLSSSFGACQGSVGPRARDCRSQLDNDCDGAPDNTLDATCQCVPGQRQDCGVGAGSRGCSRGVQTCELAAGGAQTRFGSCVFADVEDGTVCDDGNAQTVADTCQSGTCSGGRVLGALATGSATAGACAVRSGGAVYCWTGADGPFEAIALPGPAASVSVGAMVSCALLTDGQVYCWGNNGLGGLGIGHTDPVEGPVATAAPNIIQVVSGELNTAAVNAAGTLLLWGAGTGPSQPELFGPNAGVIGPVVDFPFSISELAPVEQLGLGFRHACALLRDGQVACWGRNDFSQLGRPTTGANDAQETASGVELNGTPIADAVGISSGDGMNCAVRANGTVVCWGSYFASLPTPAVNLPPAPVPGLQGVVQVSVGSSSACALRRNGTVACWGGNVAGELGSGSLEPTLQPENVDGLTDAVLLGDATALGGRYVCALRSTDDVVCWGDGTNSAVPVAVVGLPD